jgi:Xaa-Pro aminopeptidase
VTRASDRAQKLGRLREIVAARAARGLLLTSAESLAWLFDGARVSVPLGGPAVLAASVDAGGSIVVHAPANEADRLRDEELGGEVEIRTLPWFEPLPDAADGWLAEADIAAELRAARASLLPAELDRYRALGAEVAALTTAVLASTGPEHTERGVAAELAARLIAAGAEPVVLLVAGEARAGVPHPLPTSARLGARAMAVVGARRDGLIVNLTRWVGAEAPDRAGEAALREVEADAFAATVPGRSLHDVLGDIARSYARHGFGADAWLRHHQGGPTGYLGRDPKATPASADRVVAGQAFAWNPWVPGFKLEDTVVVHADRMELLTADPRWPVVEVQGRPRPRTLGYGEEPS